MPTARSTLKARWIAGTATCGVAVAVVATARPLMRGIVPPYDATLLLTGATAIALIWTGYFAWGTFVAQSDTLEEQRRALAYQRQRDENATADRRRALSEAMQVELQSLASVVNGLRGDVAPPHGEDALRYPILDRALESVEVFALNTIRILADVMREIDALRATVDAYSVYATGLDRGGTGHVPMELLKRKKDIQQRAGPVASKVDLLLRELVNESREHPEPRPVPISGYMDVTVPPRSASDSSEPASA